MIRDSDRLKLQLEGLGNNFGWGQGTIGGRCVNMKIDPYLLAINQGLSLEPPLWTYNRYIEWSRAWLSAF